MEYLPQEEGFMTDTADTLKKIEATHFIRGVLYGGELVACVRFEKSEKSDG